MFDHHWSFPFRFLKNANVDWPLFMAVAFLFAIGELVLYSTVHGSLSIIWHQATKFAVSLLVMLAVAQIHPRRWRRFSPAAYLIGVVLLVVVLKLGHVGLGARRWLDLGPLHIEPSEFMNLFLPMMLAWLLSRKPLPVGGDTLLWAIPLIFLPALLVSKEPDLGTATLIVMAGVVAIFLGGVRYRYLVLGLLVCVALVPVFWHFIHEYQRARILTFLDPQRAPLAARYHILQSTIAIGSGGLYGQGWPRAAQAQLGFLPESRTDFIFSVFSEQFGLLGSIVLLFTYLFIVGRGLWIAAHAGDNYARLLAGCLSLMFAADVFINVYMTMGLLPVVGVPLPFMSYGGTSLTTTAAAMGLLQSIGARRPLVGT